MSDHEFLLGVPKKEPVIDNYKDEEEEEEDEDESIPEGLHDEHKGSLPISYNNGFPIGYQTPSMKGDLKKNSSGKRLKPDDEEEDVKIESYIQRDVKSISVKDMRKLVPKLRIECFYTEQELSGKKKMKHLWDQKPASWPNQVPFKDPNNPGKEGTAKKPGKNDLMKMYTYLRDVYLKNKGLSFGSAGGSPTVQVPQQQQPPQQYHVYQQDPPQTYFQHPYQSHQLHQQHNMQQHFPQQFHPQLAYSPSNELSGLRKLAQPESMDEGQLIPSQVDLAVTGRMTNMSCTPSPPTTITNGNVTQEVVKEEPFIIPNVVKELYNRIDLKVGAVVGLQGVTDNVREQLLKVIEEVLNPIYNLLKNTSFCLMYLDAGHQMEALLDCMIVLGKVEANLLSSGCIEIKKKFQNFEVWHFSSFISKSLSYPETSQSCVTDCVKFRIRDHQNANIPIDQREIDHRILYEPDKNVQKFAMHEINQEIGTFYVDFKKVELQSDNSPQTEEDMNLLEDLDLSLDLSDICENEFHGNLLGDWICGDLNSAPPGQFNPQELLPQQTHQTSSVPTHNTDMDLLLNDSSNPFLSSSSSLVHVEGDFANLMENLSSLSSISSHLSGGVNQPFTNGSSYLFSNIGGYGQSTVSETSFSLCEQQGRSCHVIPKFVEDMDCSDDYAACNQKTVRQSKRRKK